MQPDVGAVIVAAGRGVRAQAGSDAGEPKQFRLLGGIPLLLRAIRPFAQHPRVGPIVVVLPAEQAASPPDWLRALVSDRLLMAVGGAERQQSVANGLATLPRGPSLVLVHDAARPLVEVELVEAVAREALASGAALPVLPLVDTVKRVRGGRVVETLDRAELGGAQTPQGFRYSLLRKAIESARLAHLELTDESMAVERMGHRVHAVPGSKRNRKLTTPDDLAWAESVVAGILRT